MANATLRVHPHARRRWRARLAFAVRKLLSPPPKLSLAEWADRYRFINGAPWRTVDVPYLREPMEAITDPRVQSVVMQKASRIGATEALIVNVIGYYAHQDPSAILVVQPTLDDGQTFSKDILEPALRETPVLADLIAPTRSIGSTNTILSKRFPGGRLGIVGTNSPRMLRMRSARIVLFDEIDAYVASSGEEGDPVYLGEKRAGTFWNRKLVKCSSPKLKGSSKIVREWQHSDQGLWHIPCPHCQHEQPLLWDQVRWDKTGEGAAKVHQPDTAHYVCIECGGVIEEKDKRAMVRAGRYIQLNPGHRVRGFKVNALASLFEPASWANLVREFLKAKEDPVTLQVFVNTVLGEPWEDRGERPDTAALAKRREVYAAEVPAGVGVLTAAVDVQRDRLELLVLGWGVGQESWHIVHHRIEGDPGQDSVWGRLDLLLARPYQHELGAQLRIQCTIVDSSDQTDAVYQQVKPRQKRAIYAAKGMKDRGKPLVVRPGKAKDKGIRLVLIGTHTAKSRLFARLRRTEPGPGYLHFPQAQADGLDDEYLAQFEGEKIVSTVHRNGEKEFVFKKIARNEAIDLNVMAMAALLLLGDAVVLNLPHWVARVAAEGRARAGTPTAASSLPSVVTGGRGRRMLSGGVV